MKPTFKSLTAAGLFAITAVAASGAHAGDRYERDDDDYRKHSAKHYDDRKRDKQYRGERKHDKHYRSDRKHDKYDDDRRYKSGSSFSITIGNNGYGVNYHDGYHGDYRGRKYDRGYYKGAKYGRRGRIVNKQIYDTRYRARIVLTEEVVRGRHGPRLVCFVRARGPEADYVSRRRINRIANRDCSYRARINVYS